MKETPASGKKGVPLEALLRKARVERPSQPRDDLAPRPARNAHLRADTAPFRRAVFIFSSRTRACSRPRAPRRARAQTVSACEKRKGKDIVHSLTKLQEVCGKSDEADEVRALDDSGVFASLGTYLCDQLTDASATAIIVNIVDSLHDLMNREDYEFPARVLLVGPFTEACLRLGANRLGDLSARRDAITILADALKDPKRTASKREGNVMLEANDAQLQDLARSLATMPCFELQEKALEILYILNKAETPNKKQKQAKVSMLDSAPRVVRFEFSEGCFASKKLKEMGFSNATRRVLNAVRCFCVGGVRRGRLPGMKLSQPPPSVSRARAGERGQPEHLAVRHQERHLRHKPPRASRRRHELARRRPERAAHRPAGPDGRRRARPDRVPEHRRRQRAAHQPLGRDPPIRRARETRQAERPVGRGIAGGPLERARGQRAAVGHLDLAQGRRQGASPPRHARARSRVRDP